MKNDIIYIRGRSEEHEELIAAFKKRNFNVHIVRDVSAACELAQKKTPAACILDASSSEAEVSERVIELTTAKELYSRPLVFIGKRASEHYHSVQQKFYRYIAVDYPFSIDKLFERFAEAKAGDSEEILTPDQTARSLTFTDPSKISSGHGGVFLLHADSLAAFDDDVLLPDHPRKANLQKALDAMTTANDWLGVHARRTGYLSSALANSNNLGAADDKIRTSALMLNWSLARGGDVGLKFDLFRRDSSNLSEKVAAAFRSSADIVSEKLEDDDAAQVIQAIASIIGATGEDIPKEVRAAAEVVILAEATDRACWRYGRFNHFGANRALRSLRDTSMITTKELKDGMGRVIAEAVLHQDPDANAFRRSLTRHQKAERRLELETAQARATELYSDVSTKEVHLFNLTAGMCLAQPLVSLDGKLILPANTVLDKDVIFRVFQLAAVRPLHNPIVIVKS